MVALGACDDPNGSGFTRRSPKIRGHAGPVNATNALRRMTVPDTKEEARYYGASERWRGVAIGGRAMKTRRLRGGEKAAWRGTNEGWILVAW